MQGSIKKIIPEKGFGFITPDDGAKDLFFHSSEVKGVTFPELKEGDKVSFEVGESPKGPNAVNVTRI
jgi:cold shock protein